MLRALWPRRRRGACDWPSSAYVCDRPSQASHSAYPRPRVAHVLSLQAVRPCPPPPPPPRMLAMPSKQCVHEWACCGGGGGGGCSGCCCNTISEGERRHAWIPPKDSPEWSWAAEHGGVRVFWQQMALVVDHDRLTGERESGGSLRRAHIVTVITKAVAVGDPGVYVQDPPPRGARTWQGTGTCIMAVCGWGGGSGGQAAKPGAPATSRRNAVEARAR